MARRRGTFVYAICGNEHVARVNVSLRFLKRVTNADILVIAARSTIVVDHDQVLRPEVPASLTDSQVAIYLKTSLPRIMATTETACYIDSDQIAISQHVDEVFNRYVPPATFAQDHGDIESFSRYAVRCGCKMSCSHLIDQIRRTFLIDIDVAWRHWNGGMFLFDSRSLSFFRTWHEYTFIAFDDPLWATRDQGTLIAAVWKHGLQDHPTLPDSVTRIVDRFERVPLTHRERLPVARYWADLSYRLDGSDTPSFLHFINGGIGCIGWRNWDDVEGLLTRSGVGHAS